MSQVEFDEFQIQSYTNFDDTPKIFNWVIKYSGGLIKNKYQAQYVLFGFITLLVVSSLFFTKKAFNDPKYPPKGYEGDILKSETYQDF